MTDKMSVKEIIEEMRRELQGEKEPSAFDTFMPPLVKVNPPAKRKKAGKARAKKSPAKKGKGKSKSKKKPKAKKKPKTKKPVKKKKRPVKRKK